MHFFNQLIWKISAWLTDLKPQYLAMCWANQDDVKDKNDEQELNKIFAIDDFPPSRLETSNNDKKLKY